MSLGTVWAYCSLVVLIVLVPLWFGVPPWNGYQSTQWAVFLVLVWSALRLSQIVGRGADRIVSLGFWIYVYLFLGLAPLVQVERGWSLPGSYTTEPGTAATIVIVGLAAYELARIYFRRRQPGDGPIERFLTRPLRAVRMKQLTVVAFVSSAAILALIGGPGILTSSRQTFQVALGGDSVGAFKISLLTVPAFLALYLAIAARRTGLRKANGWTIMALLALNIAVNNPIVQARFWLGTMAVALACVYLHLERKRTLRWFAVAWVAAFVVVFPYADAFRFEGTSVHIETSVAELINTKGDHDSFQQIANTVRYTDDSGFDFGRQALGVALFWVPRAVWDGKPDDTGRLIGTFMGYTNTNLAEPLWAEGYVNFGLVGVVLFLGLFGAISERLEAAWLARRSNPSALTALLVPPLAAYQIVILRGSLLQAMGRVVVVVLIIWWVTSKVASRERQAA